MKFAGIYGILIGILMIVQWTFFIATGQVPELETEPVRIGFHLAGEFITALGLIISGIGLLRRAAWSRSAYFLSTGMLAYSAIVSPGYFAQQGQWIFVLMFAVLLALALYSVFLLVRQLEQEQRTGRKAPKGHGQILQ
jgi:hypothetical protein